MCLRDNNFLLNRSELGSIGNNNFILKELLLPIKFFGRIAEFMVIIGLRRREKMEEGMTTSADVMTQRCLKFRSSPPRQSPLMQTSAAR